MAIIIAAASTGTEEDVEYDDKPSPVSKRKKRGRKLNSLEDSDEEAEEEESEEYKASEWVTIFNSWCAEFI